MSDTDQEFDLMEIRIIGGLIASRKETTIYMETHPFFSFF